MIQSTLIQNIDIVFPDKTLNGDILLENGKVSDFGPRLKPHAEQVINGRGLTAFPGFIDAHVHFRDPGVTHKEDLLSGSMAAAAGGVTSFFDMPNTKPSTITRDLIAEKKALASEKSIVNYNFFIGATPENLDELNDVENVPGIKIFVGSSTGSLLVDKQEDLERIFGHGSRLIAVHSEDEATIRENLIRYEGSTDVSDHARIRNPEAAIKCTQRLVELANRHNRRLHILHLTTEEESLYLEGITRLGGLITTEVSPQHLLLCAPDCYDRLGTLAQINPPIREKRHMDALVKALRSGVIQMIATDHAPHLMSEKDQPFPKAPSGMPGVETMFSLVYAQKQRWQFSDQQVAAWLSSNPAQVYDIQNKGRIAKGFDADLALVDTQKTYPIRNDMIQSRCGWSAFDGYSVTGKPMMTLVNGQLVFAEGDFFLDIKGKEIQIGSQSR